MASTCLLTPAALPTSVVTTIHNAKTGVVVKDTQTWKVLAMTENEDGSAPPLPHWGFAATALVAKVRVADGGGAEKVRRRAYCGVHSISSDGIGFRLLVEMPASFCVNMRLVSECERLLQLPGSHQVQCRPTRP